MQVRKIFLFILSCTGLLCLNSLQAQNVVTNENGEKILVYPDGSWRYFEEGMLSDSTQLSTAAQSIQEEKNQIEEENKKPNNKKSKKQRKHKNKKKSRKADSQKEKKTEVVNGLDDKLLRQARNQQNLAEKEVSRLEEQIKDVSFNRIFLEKELEDAHALGEVTLDDLMVIEQRLKVARKLENKVKAELSLAKKSHKQWSRILDLSPAKRKKAMSDFVDTTPEAEYTEQDDFTAPSMMLEADATADNNDFRDDSYEESTAASNSPTRPKRKQRKLKPYHKSEDVRYNPPTMDNCEFTFNGVDEFSGKKRRELAPQQFFTYTSDQLRPYFKDREYITCMANLTALSGGLKYLTLEFTISSPNAQREFGLLEKGSPISLKFLDGTTLKLINTKTDMGTLDPVAKTVTYRGQFSINSGAEKFLKKNEIDLVRVVWSQGYEDYEIYYMDFIADQFRCFD